MSPDTLRKFALAILATAIAVMVAACGGSGVATNPDGSAQWSDSQARTFMKICEASGVAINYDCECLQNAMIADGRSPDANPGDLPSGDLKACRN